MSDCPHCKVMREALEPFAELNFVKVGSTQDDLENAPWQAHFLKVDGPTAVERARAALSSGAGKEKPDA